MYSSLFSLFFLLMIGYIAKRIRVIPQNQSIIFVDFVINFALPALIFDRVYHVNVDIKLLYVMILGFCSTTIGAIVAGILAYIFKFSRVTAICILFMSLFGNTIFVGLPIAQGILGDKAANLVILYDQATTSIPLAVFAPFILSFAGVGGAKISHIIKKVIKFPPFIALILAIIFRNITLPEIVFKPLELLSKSVVPVALFSIGLGLSFNCIKSSWKSASLVLLGKMIIPAFIYISFIRIFNIEINKDWILGAILCTTPPMVTAGAMVMKANLDSNLAISSIALGIILTFVTMPIIFNLI